VLFTFLAGALRAWQRAVTSNLPFSKWEQIFKDPMTTAAAVDRLVHHSVIVELNIRATGPSGQACQADGGVGDGVAVGRVAPLRSPSLRRAPLRWRQPATARFTPRRWGKIIVAKGEHSCRRTYWFGGAQSRKSHC